MREEDRPAIQAFTFFECAGLLQPTGERARDLSELLSLIRTVEPGVIYHHTHQYYLKAAVEVPEYPNDFAVWAAEYLEERALAEKLAGLDLYAYRDVEEVRRALIGIIEGYLRENPMPRPVRIGTRSTIQSSGELITARSEQLGRTAWFRSRSNELIGWWIHPGLPRAPD